MTMRPFYRSRLFWLGVPGLVFLLWVWWDSGKWASSVSWERSQRSDCVDVASGVVGWERNTYRDTGPAVSNGLGFDRRSGSSIMDFPGEEELDQEDEMRRFDLRKAYTWTKFCLWADSPDWLDIQRLRVALWVVVLVYVAMWLGAVWWWRRRKARVMRRETEVAM